jgi:hypothetical protein
MKFRVQADMEFPDDWFEKAKAYQSERFGREIDEDEAVVILRDILDETFQEEISSEEDGLFIRNVTIVPLDS